MDSEDVKICINCTHCWQPTLTAESPNALATFEQDGITWAQYQGYWCTSIKRVQNLVTGIRKIVTCDEQRSIADGRSCGPNGLWYEQRQTPLDTSGVV